MFSLEDKKPLRKIYSCAFTTDRAVVIGPGNQKTNLHNIIVYALNMAEAMGICIFEAGEAGTNISGYAVQVIDLDTKNFSESEVLKY